MLSADASELRPIFDMMLAAKARADATTRPCVVTVQHDFSAAMQVEQKETQCAQHALTHHLYVVCASWNARRVTIPNQVREGMKKKKNRDKTHALIRDTLAAFVYSEHPQNVRHRICASVRVRSDAPWMFVCACATVFVLVTSLCLARSWRTFHSCCCAPHLRHYRRQADYVFVSLLLILGWLCTGEVLPELGHLGVEAFFDSKRVVGSCTKVPLDESSRLQEQDPASPRQPLVDNIELLHLLNDGCAAQFNCKHAHFWIQASSTLEGYKKHQCTAGRLLARGRKHTASPTPLACVLCLVAAWLSHSHSPTPHPQAHYSLVWRSLHSLQ